MGLCLSLTEEPRPPAEVVAQERPQISSENVQVPSEQPVKKRLSKIDPEDVPDVPRKDEVIRVRVIDVHDGDTIKVLFEFGGEIMKISLRVLGVDTPEVTAGHGRLPEEKIAGLKAKEFVRQTLQNAEANEGVRIRIRDWDKFGGRALADVLLPGDVTLTDTLIKQGYARPYNGEKKKEWTLKELTSPPFV